MMDIQKLIQDAESADAVGALMQDVNPHDVLELAEKLKEANAQLAALAKKGEQMIFAITDKNTGVLEQLSGDDVYFNLEDAEREVLRRKRDYDVDYGVTAFTSPAAPPAPFVITDKSLRAAVRIWNRAEFPSPDVYDAMRAALAGSVADE